MNAATANRSRPVAHASCDGRRLRAYCSATATANAPETRVVTSGTSTDPSLAPADDQRRGHDTQNYGTGEWHTGRVRAAGGPRERGRDDRVARAGCRECGEDVAPQCERGRARKTEDQSDGGERDSEGARIDARTTRGGENDHGNARCMTRPPQ